MSCLNLPDEIWAIILSFITEIVDVLNLRLTSVSFRYYVDSYTETIRGGYFSNSNNFIQITNEMPISVFRRFSGLKYCHVPVRISNILEWNEISQRNIPGAVIERSLRYLRVVISCVNFRNEVIWLMIRDYYREISSYEKSLSFLHYTKNSGIGLKLFQCSWKQGAYISFDLTIFRPSEYGMILELLQMFENRSWLYRLKCSILGDWGTQLLRDFALRSKSLRNIEKWMVTPMNLIDFMKKPNIERIECPPFLLSEYNAILTNIRLLEPQTHIRELDYYIFPEEVGIFLEKFPKLRELGLYVIEEYEETMEILLNRMDRVYIKTRNREVKVKYENNLKVRCLEL